MSNEESEDFSEERKKVKKAIAESVKAGCEEVETENKNKELSLGEREALLFAEERKAIIKMRSRWSEWILTLIVLITVFDFSLVFLVGFGVFHFRDEEVIIFVGESILKIVGFAYLIVHFLFNHNSLSQKK